MKLSSHELACLMDCEITVSQSRRCAMIISAKLAQLHTDLLPASPIGVGDHIKQRFGQVAVIVEGIVPPTDGYVGEVPVRGDRRTEGSKKRCDFF